MTAAPSFTRDDELAAIAASSLEWKLTDPNAFGLTTASPLQRAICRIADGRKLGGLAQDPDVVRALNVTGDLRWLGARPGEMSLVCGVRGGKSTIAAAAAVHMSQTCDLSHLRKGEIPRVSVVSVKKDLADVVFSHVLGGLRSPLLAHLQIGEPTADTVRVRAPSGHEVEIMVVAGSKAGSSLVARWSAGCIFDEFTRMNGELDGVVNWEHERRAVLLRLLEGAQIWNLGSPWAPMGPAYDLVQANWGKPTRQHVVLRASAPAMNPQWWTPARCAEALRTDPDAYRTDVEGEFATPEQAFLSAEALAAATRAEPERLIPEPGLTYAAAMDPATRGNGWTLIVTTRKGPKKIVALATEWIGSRGNPLDPGDVLAEIAGILAAYRVTRVDTDQHLGDALITLGRQVGLTLLPTTHTDGQRTDAYLAIRTRILLGEVELPPVARLRSDLLHLRKRVTKSGASIDLPHTSDGRHCDYAPALMLALSRYLADERPVSAKGEDPETKRMRDKVNARFKPKESW